MLSHRQHLGKHRRATCRETCIPRNSSKIVMAQKQIWSETNCASFDLPETEVESVASYNVEYAQDVILNSSLVVEAVSGTHSD
ncbi:hypothetical protein CsSME_00020698 [Camellia sinensis var. sinensis]